MNKTQKVGCACKSAFQDEMYGNGQRVTTPVNKEQKKGNFVVRCTVCAREFNLGSVK